MSQLLAYGPHLSPISSSVNLICSPCKEWGMVGANHGPSCGRTSGVAWIDWCDVRRVWASPRSCPARLCLCLAFAFFCLVLGVCLSFIPEFSVLLLYYPLLCEELSREPSRVGLLVNLQLPSPLRPSIPPSPPFPHPPGSGSGTYPITNT